MVGLESESELRSFGRRSKERRGCSGSLETDVMTLMLIS